MNLKNKNCDVLVVNAHPDDAEMWMAGTMIKLVEAGYSMVNLALTQSEMSTFGDIESRRKEFEAASHAIGCRPMMMDFPDTGIENNRESRIKLARVIRELRPKIVFAPYHTNPLGESRGIANVDHYEAGALARDAIKFARLQKTVPELEKHSVEKLYFFLLPRNIWPNIVVDVSDEMERVKQVISCYRSQMEIGFSGKGIEKILELRRANQGMQIGVDFAETFVTDQSLSFSAKHFFEV